MATRVDVPKIGLTTKEITVTKWLKDEGDAVAEAEAIIEVLTDKVSMEIEAPHAGVLLKIVALVDSVVPVEGALCWIGEAGEELVETELMPAAGGAEEPAAAPQAVDTPDVGSVEATGPVKASLAAKRAARTRGIDLALVTGTGPGGRVTEDDVAKYADQQAAGDMVRATPLARKLAAESGVDLTTVSGSGSGGRVRADDVSAVLGTGATATDLSSATRAGVPLAPAEIASVVPMAGLRRIVAQRMFESARTIPRVTHTTEADVTETVRMRERLVAQAESQGRVRISYTDIVVKVAARALREHPRMNARLAEEEIQVLDAVNVGVAVAVPDGLAVPVIHSADTKNLNALANESRDKIERARAGTLTAEDFAGGTFTVTNLGSYEIDAFTPIVNLPEAGILGVGRIVQKPAVLDGQIAIRSMMYLSLTFDHRIIDGAPAAAFLRTVKQYLENPYELMAVC